MLFTHNASHPETIKNHLETCDASFVPLLSKRVVIADYSKKLFNYAERFECWDQDNLIALLAIYCNDPSKKVAFLSNLSVMEAWRKLGIAQKLLNTSFHFLKEKKFEKVELKTDINNIKAISFYIKNNFNVNNDSSISTASLQLHRYVL